MKNLIIGGLFVVCGCISCSSDENSLASSEGELYKISTLGFTFESRDAAWPDIKKRFEETSQRRQDEFRKGEEDALKGYVVPKNLDGVLCNETCKEEIAKIVGVNSPTQCLVENSCHSVPFTATISGVEKKVLGVRGGDGTLVIKDGKAFRIKTVSDEEVETVSIKVLGDSSWNGTCRDTGGHCDPLPSSSEIIHFYDVTDLAAFEVLKDEITVRIPISGFKILFEFSQSSSSSCKVEQVVSSECSRESLKSINLSEAM